jgi:hypothetical protein
MWNNRFYIEESCCIVPRETLFLCRFFLCSTWNKFLCFICKVFPTKFNSKFKMFQEEYDVIVVGAGHAGSEAAAAWLLI